MSREIPRAPLITTVGAPTGFGQRAVTATLRALSRASVKLLVRPPFSVGSQRMVARLQAGLAASEPGLNVDPLLLPFGGEIISPAVGDADGAILYLHGGAYCSGSPASVRPITTRLAASSRSEVWVPAYRLAPEHPYPAALDDAVDTYRQMLMHGHAADQIVIAGDGAGAGLALALAFRLRELSLPLPAGLALLSPWVDMSFDGESMRLNGALDPLLSRAWLAACARHYRAGAGRQNPHCSPLFNEFGGMPQMLIQVGSDELLLDDATRLAQRASVHGADVRLTVFSGMWHVFQRHADVLQVADQALQQLAGFIAQCRQVPFRETAPATAELSASQPAWSM